MIEKESVNLGSGSIGKLLISLAAPSILAQLINALYNMIDRVYIGHLHGIGAEALTGVGVCFPLIMTVSAFAALVSMGGAPKAAIFMGKKENDNAEKVLGNCTSAMIILSIVLTVLIQLKGKNLLMIFGASDVTIKYAWEYMKYYSLGTIFVQLSLGLNAFINTQGFSKIGMMTVLIGAILNIILDPIFMFALDMGVSGAAIATITSQAVSAVWCLHFLTGNKTQLHIRKKNLHIEKEIMLPVIALGLSPFIMQFTEAVLNLSFNTQLKAYGGDIAVGAMTILGTAMQLTMLPLQGLMQGAQPIMSYNFGARNFSRVKATFRLALKCCLLLSSSVWILAMIFPQAVAMIFTSNPALIKYTSWALRIYFIGAGIFGIQGACQQSFLALGNAKTSLFIALLRKVFLLIPLIFIMPKLIPGNPSLGIFMAEPISDIVSVIICSILFFRFYKTVLSEDHITS